MPSDDEPQIASQFLERCHLLEAQQTESFGERRAAFERADDESACEALAGARAEGQIEVASATRGECTQPLDFVVVGFMESRNIQSSVAHAAENHECAHLESARQPIHLCAEVSVSIVVVLKDIERDEQLGGYFVAPTLDAIVRDFAGLRIGDGGLAEPD